ncbi:MAG TPA: hypothetical protein EYH34_06795 [Planctomycetes bacterium]|nr:hypothetical protein [Planctomycetota bacterium]
MIRKRKLLSSSTRQALLEIAYELEIPGLTGKNRDQIVDSLAGSRRASAQDILELLTRDELESVCRKLGLDETGRAKQVLIDRLLGRDERRPRRVAEGNPMAKRRKKNTGDGTLFKVSDYRHTKPKRKTPPRPGSPPRGPCRLCPRSSTPTTPGARRSCVSIPPARPTSWPSWSRRPSTRRSRLTRPNCWPRPSPTTSRGWNGPASRNRIGAAPSRSIRSSCTSTSASAPRPSSAWPPARTSSGPSLAIPNWNTTRRSSSIGTISTGRTR